MKPVVLALIGVIVILAYAALMMFGGEFLVWVGVILTPLAAIQIGVWSWAKH